MMLVPIARDTFRPVVPWVSVSLIAVCTLVQIVASARAPDEAQVEDAARRVFELEMQLSAASGPADARGGMSPLRQQAFLSAVRAGREPLADPETVERLREADAVLERLLRRDLALRLAYRPTDGLSWRMVSSAFAHAGWVHLVGNMVFLWLIGTHLELLWGKKLFALLYGVGIFAASFAYARFHPGSLVGCVGASGAIAATMGAFLVCYWKAECRYWWVFAWPGRKLRSGAFNFYPTFFLPAWALEQYSMSNFEDLGFTTGVAYSAHLGGLLLGMSMAAVFRATGAITLAKSFVPDERDKAQEEQQKRLSQAETLVLSGQPLRAMEALDEVLARDPLSAPAHALRLRAALKLQDLALVQSAGNDLLLLYASEQTDEPLVAAYRDIERELPAAAFDDQVLAAVFRAAVRRAEDKLAHATALKLARGFPASPLSPTVLLELDELHRRAGRADVARQVLDIVIDKYPGHEAARQAEHRLQGAKRSRP